MTACFLFSAAGSESPSFNYFRNFADPVSVLLCQRKWDLQQRPLHSHSRLRFIENAKIYQTTDFYKILLTFHLLSFSHPRSQQLLHSQSPGPPPEENSERWITKQPHSTSLSALSLSLSLSPLSLSLSLSFRSCVDSTRSLQVKTARGHTIISNPLISRPWPWQQGDTQRGVPGPQSTDQQG